METWLQNSVLFRNVAATYFIVRNQLGLQSDKLNDASINLKGKETTRRKNKSTTFIWSDEEQGSTFSHSIR